MPSRRDFLQTALLLPAALTQNGKSNAQDTPKPKASEVFADFEGANFDGWTIEEDAFGTAPATESTFPGKICGFTGRGFLCSLHKTKGNAATGKAISKEFTIQKPFLTFKIGGGNHPNQACLNLIVDSKTVRTATGDGGATLSESSFDVSNLLGRKAHIEIVDATASGDRGYIMVDDIRFTMSPRSKYQDRIEAIAKEAYEGLGLPCLGVAVVRNGEVIALSIHGINDLKNPASAFDYNSVVRVGSISKPICGYIVARAVQSGGISWDTRFSDVRPDLCTRTAHSAINATLAQFVSHTSGLRYRRYRPDDSMNKTSLSSVRWRELKVSQDLNQSTPNGKPGAVFEYSGGMDFAAVMVEKATGKTFEALLAQYLAVPFSLPTVHLGVSSSGKKIPVCKGHVIDKTTGDFV